MTAIFGNNLKITIFGSSHSEFIGVVADGFEVGEKIDLEKIKKFLDRRKPGKNKYTSQRKESDDVKFICGIENNKIISNTICAIIKNSDVKSNDYKNFSDIPRPSQIDFTALKKYSSELDLRGSGFFSGRMTAPICVAGAIAIQILEKKGIKVLSHIKSVYNIKDEEIDYVSPDVKKLENCMKKEISVISKSSEEKIKELINNIKEEGDSFGGVVECFIISPPIGLGEPIFNSFESQLSHGIFSIPGVRYISFGKGVDAPFMKGSNHNDEFEISDNKIVTKTNNSGGIVGGITNGMPIVFSVAFKPTASISKEQNSVSISKMQKEKLVIHGRHDPCFALRTPPVVEAIASLVLLDFMKG
ncbi:MAG: chorismate synthase [Peptoniphilaceae bacterium]|nr:chorismate synthase [Peptoniphilaceae bacterium]